MPKAFKPEGGDFKQLDAGVFPARCYSVIDIGTHISEYMGAIKNKHQVRITWEFPTELNVFDESKGEQPFVLSKVYTLSLFENSQLRKDLESWLGRSLTPQEEAEGYELSELIGKVCQIQVIHVPSKKDPSKSYATINGIMSVPKGMTVPDQINPDMLIEQEDWNTSKFNMIPEFIQNKIKESQEWKENDSVPEFE